MNDRPLIPPYQAPQRARCYRCQLICDPGDMYDVKPPEYADEIATGLCVDCHDSEKLRPLIEMREDRP